MKKFLLTITAIFMCITAHAKTETINWYMDGNTYATTQCETGSDIILPQTPYKYGYTFNGWASYRPIEYLESTGTQYIDTGVVPKEFSKIKIEFMPTSLSNSFVGVMSSRIQPEVDVIGFGMSTIYTSANFGTRPEINIPALSVNKLYVISEDKTEIVVNSVSYPFTATGTYSFSSNLSIPLFARNNNGTVENYFIGRIYYAKIYDNNVLVRDFIPVLDLNNVPCMYDRVEKKFYYNAGTGQFVAGPVLTE